MKYKTSEFEQFKSEQIKKIQNRKNILKYTKEMQLKNLFMVAEDFLVLHQKVRIFGL